MVITLARNCSWASEQEHNLRLIRTQFRCTIWHCDRTSALAIGIKSCTLADLLSFVRMHYDFVVIQIEFLKHVLNIDLSIHNPSIDPLLFSRNNKFQFPAVSYFTFTSAAEMQCWREGWERVPNRRRVYGDNIIQFRCSSRSTVLFIFLRWLFFTFLVLNLLWFIK